MRTRALDLTLPRRLRRLLDQLGVRLIIMNLAWFNRKRFLVSKVLTAIGKAMPAWGYVIDRGRVGMPPSQAG